MKNPNVKTKVKHSESKNAWNVIATSLGRKYKITRIPYLRIPGNKVLSDIRKTEAFEHAEFISFCFNNSDDIIAKQDNESEDEN